MSADLPTQLPFPRKSVSQTQLQRERFAAGLVKPIVSPEQQLSLFDAFAAGTPSAYTNLLEFFDALPKFFLTPQSSVQSGGKNLEIAEFNFAWGDIDCQVSITPTVVKAKGKDGETVRKELLPGPREETVYRVLRKMASDPDVSKRVKGESIVLRCSIYHLRSRLAAVGHEFKASEIREALEVLGQTPLRVTNLSTKKTIYSGSYITLAYAADETDIKGDRTLVEFSFNRLAVVAITQGLYDRIHYERLMGLNPLPGWIYELIVRNFRQAGADCGYTLSMSRVLRESGLPPRKDARGNLRQIREALKQLQDNKVLAEYPPIKESIEKSSSGSRGRKAIKDVVWTLFPSQEVIDDIKNDNAGKKARRLELGA